MQTTVPAWVTAVALPAAVDVDPTPGARLAASVEDQLEDCEVHGVLLDLSRLPILSAGFVGRLVTLHQRAEQLDKSLVLCGANPVGRDVLRRTRLDTVFTLAPSVDAARQAFGRT